MHDSVQLSGFPELTLDSLGPHTYPDSIALPSEKYSMRIAGLRTIFHATFHTSTRTPPRQIEKNKKDSVLSN